MNKIKRILHLNWRGEIGGAERFTFNLASKQKDIGMDVVIGYMADSHSWNIKCHETGIPVATFNMKNGFDFFHFLNYLIFLYRFKPDIIHAHDPTPMVYITKIFYPKCIFIRHVHGSNLGNEKWEKTSVILWNRQFLKYVDHFIANSHHTKKILLIKYHLPEQKVSVVYNGIDLHQFKPNKTEKVMRKELSIEPKSFVVGSVGRLHEQKGFDLFIEVAHKLACKNRNFTFIIVGDGDQRDNLIDQARVLNLNNHIIFTGFRTDIPEMISVFDIFLLTSKWEPFGIVLLEAMCIGKPIIAFRVDGISEVVNDDTAILIDPWDTDKMAAAILSLTTNRDRQSKLIQNGYKRVRDFDLGKITLQINDLYSSLTP
jgi:glycosyltransferase involved in cell wall biosynthesis